MSTGTTVADSHTADRVSSGRVAWLPAALRRGSATPLAAGPQPEARGTSAGRVLALLSVVPALLSMSWLVAAVPMAAFGQFRVITVVPLALAAAAVIVPLGIAPLRRPMSRFNAPWWATGATLIIATSSTWFVAATHSEQAILRRDAGSYAQIGLWLTHHPGLAVPVPAEAFGPSWADLTFASPGFYAPGDTIIPQFMTGWPTMLAAGGWVAGWQGMLVLPALVGGCVILAIAGLAARLVGARWAPVAALLVAVAWPMMRVSQTTYSEPLACLVLAGGLCLLLDVFTLLEGSQTLDGCTVVSGSVVSGSKVAAGAKVAAGVKVVRRAGSGIAGSGIAGSGIAGSDLIRRRARGAAFACGLVLAGGELVRLDMGVDFALLIPVIGWCWLTRRPGPGSFVLGALIGGGLGVADCAFVTLPYVQTNWSSVRLMIIGVVGAIVATAVVAVALRVWGRPLFDLRRRRWVPAVGASAVVALAIALVLRPYLQVDHSNATEGVIAYTAEMQGWLGLPIDGTRGYTEQSLWWASWYLGWPLLAAALVAATVLTARVLRGRDPRWIPVLLVYGISAVLTLLRPGITPDHPWADRRLVDEVIPAMILLGTWTAAMATRLARTGADGSVQGARVMPDVGTFRPVGVLRGVKDFPAVRVQPTIVATALVAAFVVPMLVATAPVAAKRTEIGELAAVDTVCGALRPDDSVVLLDPLWLPTIRGQCGLPVAQLANATPASLEQAASSIRAAGRTPVIGASVIGGLGAVKGTPTEVVTLHTQQDQHQLVRRPDGTDPLLIEFWLVRP